MKKVLTLVPLLFLVQFFGVAQTDLSFDVLNKQEALIFSNRDISEGEYGTIVLLGKGSKHEGAGFLQLINKEDDTVKDSHNFYVQQLTNNIADLYIDCGIESMKFDKELFFVTIILKDDKLLMYDHDGNPISIFSRIY